MILGKVQKQNNNGNIKRQKKNNSSLSQATSAVQLSLLPSTSTGLTIMDVFVWGVGYRSSVNIQVQDLEQ